MLLALRGNPPGGYRDLCHDEMGGCLADLCVSNVKMRTYTLEEIKAYVATGDPLDKAVRTLFKANLSILFGFQHGCFAM